MGQGDSTKYPDHMKKIKQTFLGNFLAVGIGILVALILAEVISRILIPIFPGAQKLGLDGEWLNIDSVHPGAVYRQYSEEYDALTTITKKGYRWPDGGDNPRIIFLGDSFTFGQGLSDKHTFPFLFCHSLQISCANLSVPGASTISELDRLENFIAREGWRPQHVLLFVFAMTQFLGAGNDLYDNLKTPEKLENLAWRSPSTGQGATQLYLKMDSDIFSDFLYFLLGFRKTLLEHSNLARAAKFYLGPQIKELVAPTAKDATLNQALLLMEKQLNRFERLEEELGFSGHIFLLHPLQDILRGTYQETILQLQTISPKTIYSTAHLFPPEPEQYFFPLDGHLNERGSQKIADYLLSDFSDFGRE